MEVHGSTAYTFQLHRSGRQARGKHPLHAARWRGGAGGAATVGSGDASLGPPVVPFLTFFLVGGFPY